MTRLRYPVQIGLPVSHIYILPPIRWTVVIYYFATYFLLRKGKLVPVYALKSYGTVELYPYSFLKVGI